METKITSHVVKGVIIALLLIAFGLITYLTGQLANKSLQYIQYVILIGGIIWSCTTYAKQLNGNVTFGNVFANGFKTTAVITVLLCIYTFIAMKLLFPEMPDKILVEAKKSMQEKNLSDEDIDKALKMTRDYLVPFAIGGILLMFSIVGAIASLIGAGVAKKKPQDPFAQQPM